MKKNIQIILSCLLVLGLMYYGYTAFFKSNKKTSIENNTKETVVVKKQNLQISLKAVGSAKLVDEQKLKFNQTGTVSRVNVKEGDHIKKNQILAELDKTSIQNDIAQAETSLNNSKINLQKLLKGSDESQILSAKNAVESTKKQIEVAKKNLIIAKQSESATIAKLKSDISLATIEVQNKQRDIETAKKNLEDTSTLTKNTLSNASTTYSSTITSAFLTGKTALTQTDSILTNLNSFLSQDPGTENNNIEYRNNLGALNGNTLITAQNSYNVARNKQKSLNNSLASIQTENYDSVVGFLQNTQTLLEATVGAGDDSYTMLQNSVSSGNFSQTTLDGLKSTTASARSSAQSQLSNIKNAITTLKNLDDATITAIRNNSDVTSKQNALTNAEYALTQAKSNLTDLNNNFESKKANAELATKTQENTFNTLLSTLSQQEASLTEVTRGATTEELALAKNDITSKTISIAKIKQNLDNYQIKSPFDGLVSAIDIKVGDNLIADNSAYISIQNPDLVQITVPFDQIDIVKVKMGQSAKVTFDAINNKTFEGKVVEIDPTAVTQSGVVSYNVTLAVDRKQERIFSGMTATVEIILSEKKDILVIPTLALKTENGKTSVKKVVSITPFQTKDIEVVVGISDAKSTEIASGLTEGDTIVSMEYTSSTSSSNSSDSSSSGNKSNSSSLQQFMRASGGGSPPR